MDVNILYPKIRELEKCPEIMSVRNVIITEKLHGKNMRVIVPARSSNVSDIVIGGREITEIDALYGLGGETRFLKENLPMKKILERFKDEKVTYVIYGEIVGLGVQKGMNYGSKEFRVFDISMAEYLLDFDETKKICGEIGLKVVPILYEGSPRREVFDSFINVKSALARENKVEETITEGIVIKSTPILKNTFGDYVICKHKSAGFEEKISAKEERTKVDSGPLALFAATYVVENRIRKMVDKLKEKGAYSGTLRDAKALGDELSSDIEIEEKEKLERILKENPELNKKMLFAEIMKIAIPIFKKMLQKEK